MDAMEKKKNSPNIAKLALVLFAVTAITALVLGLVNQVTSGIIAERDAAKTKEAYSNVLTADSYAPVDAKSYASASDGTITKLSTAKDGSGKVVGYVAETKFSGAQGNITMVVGLDADKTCTGIYVTGSSETSGLGAKASETTPGSWRDNLVGAKDGVALKKDGGTVEAISGATITSRACTKEVQTVITAVNSLG